MLPSLMPTVEKCLSKDNGEVDWRREKQLSAQRTVSVTCCLSPPVDSQRRDHLVVEVLSALDSIPGTCFILERKYSIEAVVQHNPYISLHVDFFPAIPVLCMASSVSVWCQGIETMVDVIFLLPIPEVGAGFAEGMIHFFHDDPYIDRVSGDTPMILQSQPHATHRSIVRHFFE